MVKDTGTCTWYVCSKLSKRGPATPLKLHVATPGSINFERLTEKPAREGFVSMGACTEPVRTGIGAVCVECGRSKWLITIMNHTHFQRKQKRHPTRLA